MKPDVRWLVPLLSAAAVAGVVVFAELGNRGTDADDSPPASATLQRAAPSVVPWIDTPGAPYVERATTPPDLPLYRPCAHADLAFHFEERVDGASGRYLNLVRITNSSATACTVNGPPTLAIGGTSEPRSVQAFIIRARNFSDPAGILPGHEAYAELWTPSECDGVTGRHQPPDLVVSVPGSGSYPAGVVQLELGCGRVSVSDFRRVEENQDPPARGVSVLEVRVDAPATVQPGTMLEFTVQLTNPTTERVSLEDCPSYRVVLATPGGPGAIDRLLLLNCSGAGGGIAPRGTTAFAMRLDVPADMAPSGHPKFFWVLEVDGHPSAGAPLAVVAG